MRAAVVHTFDRPPRPGAVERPDPTDGRILVDMLAAAISPRARSGAAGRHYSSTGALPMVPGIDGVGHTSDGRLVYVLALDRPDGTMAEQLAVEPDHLVELPAGIDPVTAAAAAIPGVSSWTALRSRVALRPGQDVLVLGATGVAGRMAAQIARLLGAGRVVAAGRDPDRLAGLTGADAVVPLEDDDGTGLADAASEVDVVLDYLWGPVTERAIPALVRARDTDRPLSWVSIGSAAGPQLALPAAALRAVDLRILGSGQGSAGIATLLDPVPELMAAVVGGAIDVVTRAVPLAEVEHAWTEPEQPGCRTVLTV